MFTVTKSAYLGSHVEVGVFATKAEAEVAVYALIDAEWPGKKAYIYAADDVDHPGCADFFASFGAMSIVVSINA